MNKNKNVYDGKIAGLYDLEDTLGRGHFACVKLARHVFTGEKVAVKVIDKTKLDEVSRNHLFQEVRCMKLVQHPNVVRLYEVIDTQTKLYLILELGDGGDMYDYIMKHEKGLDEEIAKKYFRQIVHAISYCHRLHVVHRDLKPENVVFFEKLGMVKLTDFGFSNRFCPGQKLETSCGSLAYSAPEILLGDLYDAPAVDVWSLGVILFMLVCGQAPFQEANDSETLTMIMDCKYTIPSHVSAECTRLIGKMLIRDPEKRATLEEITTDPWLESTANVQYSDYLPLVSREHLSDEDHAHIIQKMVTGNIAVQEEILNALDKNAYNHITATYFLLAERKLRALRQERAKLLNASHVSDLSALAISPRNPTNPACPPVEPSLPRTVDSLLSPQETRRTLTSPGAIPSMLESLQSLRNRSGKHPCMHLAPTPIDNVATVLLGSPPAVPHKQRNYEVTKNDGYKSLDLKKKKRLSADLERHVTIAANERTDMDEDEAGASAGSNELVPMATAPSKPNKFKPITSPNNRKLHSVRSSPQLTLNEIYEEVESDGEAAVASKFHTSCISNSTSSSPATRVLKVHQSVTSPVIQRKYEQRRRYAKARTASCSSSDASDEDTEVRKRKAEKLRLMPGWRDGRNRDDDDDGGDQGNNGMGPQGGSAAYGNDVSSSKDGGQSRGSDPSQHTPIAGGSQRCGVPEQEPLLSKGEGIATISGCPIAAGVSTSSPNLPLAMASDSEERRTVSCVNAILVNSHLRKAEELRQKWAASPSASESSSPLYAHSRSPASIARSMADSASPPPSPLGTPNITSLRQSKTLNQLNRFISSPTTALLGSPILDVGGKENGGSGGLSEHCSGPLHLLNLRRPGKWRPPSYPVTSSSSMLATTAAVTANGDAALGSRTNQYKHSLYRLLKHTPHLGSKRWDINRNGLNGSTPNNVGGGSARASQYSVGLRVGSTSPTSSSHSKCCSLC